MSDKDAKFDYIGAIAERFHGRFKKVKKYKVLHNNEKKSKKPMLEDAVITAFLKILGLKKATIIRPVAMREEVANKYNHIKIEFDISHNDKTIVKKTALCALPTWDEKNDIILKEDKFEFHIRLKEQIKTEKDAGAIVIDIADFKNHDEAKEVFRTELGELVLEYYNIYFFQQFFQQLLVYGNVYDIFQKALFQTDLHSIEQHAKRFTEEYKKIEENLTSSQSIKWIKMERDGSTLEQIIGKDECFLEDTTLDTDMVDLRKKIWQKYKESEVFEEKEILSYVERIDKLDYPSDLKIPFKLFEEDKNNFQHVPEDIIDPVINFSIKNRFHIEYFRTVLFAINMTGLSAERDAIVTADKVKSIQKLWDNKLKTNVSLHNFIKDYLKLWKLGNSSKSKHEKSIVLTQEWLMAWFALQVLNSKTFEAYKNNEFGPRKTIRFYHHLSTVFLYLLYWIRKYANTNLTPFFDVKNGYEAFLESLIYLISEYAHKDGGLTRNADIHRSLRYMWSHQSILYTISESYRDHLHHVLETCLMGLFFLRLDGQTPQQHGFFGIFDNKFHEQQVIRNWIVTALFHDVGYGVEMLKRQIDHLSFFETEVVVNLRERINEQFDELEKKLCIDSRNYLDQYLSQTKTETFKDLKRFDHGIISALQIVYLVEKPDQEWWQDMNMAIEAAALHNYSKAKIDHNKAPLAFLLFLCDHLQEWDRPYIEGEQMRYSLLVNLIRPNSKSCQNESMVKFLTLKGIYLNNELNPISYKTIKKLTFVLHFASAEKQKYHPPLAWVGLCENFQRIDNCNLPISIQFNHPVSSSKKRNSKNYQYDMDLFDDFLDESGRSGHDRELCGKKEKGNSVLREWIQTARDQSSWFKYDKKKHEEQLTIELQKIDGKVYIPCFPTMLVKHYIDWAERCRKGYYIPPGLTSFKF